MLGLSKPLPLAAGIKYQFSIIASGPSRLTISLNESRTSVEVRPLLDGGLLVLMLGRKHLAYGKEEVRSSLRRSNILPRVSQGASHRRQLYRSLTPDGCGRCRIGCLSLSSGNRPPTRAGRPHDISDEGGRSDAGALGRKEGALSRWRSEEPSAGQPSAVR